MRITKERSAGKNAIPLLIKIRSFLANLFNEKPSYCPRCGATVKTYMTDGTAICSECQFAFGVIENKDAKDLVIAVCENKELFS